MTAEEFQLKGQAGRLDKILTDLMPGESRSTIQKIIKDGQYSSPFDRYRRQWNSDSNRHCHLAHAQSVT